MCPKPEFLFLCGLERSWQKTSIQKLSAQPTALKISYRCLQLAAVGCDPGKDAELRGKETHLDKCVPRAPFYSRLQNEYVSEVKIIANFLQTIAIFLKKMPFFSRMNDHMTAVFARQVAVS